MIPNNQTHEIGELWEGAAAAHVAEVFADIVEMSDTLVDVVDRIIESGWHDDDFEVGPEVLEEMSQIAIAGDEEDEPGESLESVELSGKWTKVGGSSVYVVNGVIRKGCPGLKGERVDDLIDEDDDSREEREARQVHAEAAGIKGHQVTARQAKSLGKPGAQTPRAIKQAENAKALGKSGSRQVTALRAAKSAAKSYGVSTKDVIQQMPVAYKHLKQQIDEREKARSTARKKTGLDARKINQLEDKGKDYTNLARWDETAEAVAVEHPELGWTTGKDNNDINQKLWDLLKEDRDVLPNQSGPEVAELAAQMIAAAKKSGLKKKPSRTAVNPSVSPVEDHSDDWDDWNEEEEAKFNPEDYGDDSDAGGGLGDAYEGGDDDAGFDPNSFDTEAQTPKQAVIGHVSKQLQKLKTAAAELNHFKNVARSRGVDPDKVIESLGGVPFSIRTPSPATGLLRSQIAAAARVTDRNPTDAQKSAGNYKKGRFKLWGWEVVIENPRGSIRSGAGADGKPWAVRMANHYGYIRQTESEADGDHLDVFIGPDVESDRIFVVDQQDVNGDFDEHKIMIGWQTPEDARQGYNDAYSSGWDGFAGITEMAVPEFLDWIEYGDTAGPLYQAESVLLDSPGWQQTNGD